MSAESARICSSKFSWLWFIKYQTYFNEIWIVLHELIDHTSANKPPSNSRCLATAKNPRNIETFHSNQWITKSVKGTIINFFVRNLGVISHTCLVGLLSFFSFTVCVGN